MPAPWIITKPTPVVEKAAAAQAPKPKVAAPKKTRKKATSTTIKYSDK
jgi:hypothetical protein